VLKTQKRKVGFCRTLHAVAWANEKNLEGTSQLERDTKAGYSSTREACGGSSSQVPEKVGGFLERLN